MVLISLLMFIYNFNFMLLRVYQQGLEKLKMWCQLITQLLSFIITN